MGSFNEHWSDTAPFIGGDIKRLGSVESVVPALKMKFREEIKALESQRTVKKQLKGIVNVAAWSVLTH